MRDLRSALESLHYYQRSIDHCLARNNGTLQQDYFGSGCMAVFTNLGDIINCVIDLKQKFQSDPLLELPFYIEQIVDIDDVQFKDHIAFQPNIVINWNNIYLGQRIRQVINDQENSDFEILKQNGEGQQYQDASGALYNLVEKKDSPSARIKFKEICHLLILIQRVRTYLAMVRWKIFKPI